MSECRYIVGDTRDVTATLPDGSVDERNADLARERVGMFLAVEYAA